MRGNQPRRTLTNFDPNCQNAGISSIRGIDNALNHVLPAMRGCLFPCDRLCCCMLFQLVRKFVHILDIESSISEIPSLGATVHRAMSGNSRKPRGMKKTHLPPLRSAQRLPKLRFSTLSSLLQSFSFLYSTTSVRPSRRRHTKSG